ncbi:hypothetical protein AQS8620_02017 [Aquimixticola soesokkakensis]|uniref:Ceramide glucosyltransferase n=1 Tax=Aquimixticola soesokkakensis TaxID=1519096 RepID=A0A1Y5SUR1_9RHOB|nr:glycosyltransferase [Aquimixticola soesokkakensis]SLN48301.1 hypothetical protein AQS8620_02017 [Aquimixticola soesokkakensis]
MGLLWIILGLFALAALLVHVVTCAVVAVRFRKRPAPPVAAPLPLSILRPVCGDDPLMEETLETSFAGLRAPSEVIFCLASASDPALPTVRRVVARHADVARVLIGETQISGNPKLNNLHKGWHAATQDHVVMIDSNVLLPQDYLQILSATWQAGGAQVGLVTSPPVAIRAPDFGARLEAACLNTYQDRWQLAADSFGMGYAQGKVLMWRKDFLDARGGLAALSHNLAEDVASTKVVRSAGLRVRVLAQPFAQPLGPRSFAAVWQRQVRWAKVRRDGFAALYGAELLSMALVPFLALLALVLGGQAPLVLAVLFILVWYGSEWALAAVAGWPCGPKDRVAWVARDLLLPAIWGAGYAGRSFEWRGNAMGAGPQRAKDLS